jgi:predicted ABC-type transport system involved in lysophospholipase L1 biosynthesis ATPase subunit
METTSLLEIQNLTRRYPSPDGEEPLTVFENANFDVKRGEFVCIIGHSGCGKSTIMNILSGLDTATSGSVIMDGKEVAGPSLDRGVVFQNYSLLPWMSALKNVMFGVRARFPNWSRKQVIEHSYKHLEMVGLGDGAEKRLSDFLIYRFGGSDRYIQERGHPRLRMRHAAFKIGIAERDRWMDLMQQAMQETGIPPSSALNLKTFFENVADFMRNE